MNIQSNWGGGVDFKAAGAITAPTGEKLMPSPLGYAVRVFYTDPYNDSAKVMDVAYATFRDVALWTPAGSATVAVPGLIYVSSVTFDIHTAKYNTNALCDYYGTGAYAAYYCINTTPNPGVSFALPNKQQIAIIHRVRNIIDEIDPSSSASNKLSNWGFGASDGAYCWSSSQSDNEKTWSYFNGGYAKSMRTKKYGVIPILELDPTTLQPI